MVKKITPFLLSLELAPSLQHLSPLPSANTVIMATSFTSPSLGPFSLSVAGRGFAYINQTSAILCKLHKIFGRRFGTSHVKEEILKSSELLNRSSFNWSLFQHQSISRHQ
jgi:hypothetical protein